MKKFVPAPAYKAWILAWLRKEWDSLWRERPHSADWFERLSGEAAYGGADRHYHNLDHLVHGLAEIRAWAANTGAVASDVAVVKAAFWFHDAVYAHGAGEVSNEEASARLWLGSGLEPDAARADDVATLIRATDHFQGGTIVHPLKDTMLSVDLAILGQETEVYQAYSHGIRAEYAHVPEERYNSQRSQILAHLRGKAEAGTLFADPYFTDTYTAAAIANMGAELALISNR